MLKRLVDERTVTALGISIGTGLALETIFDVEIFDKDRKIPDKQNPEDYPTHIYNIYTLYRNVISSIKYKNKDELAKDRYVQEQLINDMYLLIELYKGVNVKLIFYYPDYRLAYRKYNKGKDNKVYVPFVTYSFMQEQIKKLKFPGEVYSGNVLPKLNGKTLLLSHFTVDLINSSQGLYLLESHTGKIKSRIAFSSKLHPAGKRDLSVMPLTPETLYIFGDKSLVKPKPIIDRRTIYEMAVIKKWSPNSSQSKIRSDIRIVDPKIPV